MLLVSETSAYFARMALMFRSVSFLRSILVADGLAYSRADLYYGSSIAFWTIEAEIDRRVRL
jgi:hypothetical protein